MNHEGEVGFQLPLTNQLVYEKSSLQQQDVAYHNVLVI
jgi:hypothetical protein